MPYHGAYKHSLDAKGRVFLPAKFRADLAGGVYVCPAPGGRLWIFDRETWPAFLARLSEARRIGAVPDGVETFITSNATDDSPDQQGRILLPALLRDYAGLERELWFFGKTDRIELWDGVSGDAEQSERKTELKSMKSLPV